MNPTKRQKTSQTCFLCEKHGTSSDCNGSRPCIPCVTRGNAHMCFGMSTVTPKAQPIPTIKKQSVDLPYFNYIIRETQRQFYLNFSGSCS